LEINGLGFYRPDANKKVPNFTEGNSNHCPRPVACPHHFIINHWTPHGSCIANTPVKEIPQMAKTQMLGRVTGETLLS